MTRVTTQHFFCRERGDAAGRGPPPASLAPSRIRAGRPAARPDGRRRCGRRNTGPMADVAIVELLASLGLTGEDAMLGRTVLETAGLTNPRKTRISRDKESDVRRALDAEIARLCRRCAEAAAGEPRVLVTVAPELCARCGGSANARALDGLADAAAAAGVTRLVVVGGSPDVRRELKRLPASIQVRFVDGVERRTGEQAKGDVGWADVVVVCGGSELYHRVSNLYTREPAARGKLVVASRRGVEAIAAAVVEHLRRRRA